MESISVVASIIGLIQLTGQAATISWGYIGSIRYADREIRLLAQELSSFASSLQSLLNSVEGGRMPALQVSAVDRILHDWLAELSSLTKKLQAQESKGKLKRIRILWPLKENETLRIISQIERYRSMVNLMLSLDVTPLSQAIQVFGENAYFSATDEVSTAQENTLTAKDGTQIKHTEEETEALRTWRRQEVMLKAIEKRRRVLSWIYPGDFDRDHTVISAMRTKDSSVWILKSPKFLEWSEGKGSRLLWVHGNAGSGKTVTSSAVIDFLRSQVADNQASYAVAYIYFSYKEDIELGNLLASLVKQIANQITNLPRHLELLYDEMKPRGKILTAKELYSAILVAKDSFAKVFFVFDALDECDPTLRKTEILPIIHRMAEDGIHLFLTSRPGEQDIEISLSRTPQIGVESALSDLEVFIRAEIDKSPHLGVSICHGQAKDEIISQIIKSSKGVFLSARLQIDYLIKETIAGGAPAALEKYKNLAIEGSLVNTYDHIMEVVFNQERKHTNLAFKIFSWLMNAKRPLTVEELRAAVSIGEPDLPDESTLVEVCANLVVIDVYKTTQSVKLAHYSIQEYLLSHRVLQKFPKDHNNANFNIAIDCCTFLSSDAFAQGACTSNKSLGDRFEVYPFLNYAASNLSHHLQSCDEALSKTPFLKFLGNLCSISSYLQAKSFRKQRKGELAFDQYPKGQVALHIASAIGHLEAVRALLDEAADISITDDDGQTALSLAASTGKDTVVNLLLERGANISATDNDGWTALHWASYNGHEMVIQLLLSNGANISAPEDDGKTPLSLAACGGFGEAVRLLLDKGGDLLATDGNGWTVLHWAAFGGDAAVVELLLDNGSDQSTLEKHGRTALSLAASEGFEAVVLLLLNRGGDPLALDKNGWTAMHWAASKGQVAVVKLLLEKKVEPSILDKHRRTPLSLATSEGHTAIIEILDISPATSPPLLDEDTRKRLFLETSKGNEAVVRSLLDNGESVSARDGNERTLLYVAAWKGYEAIVELLLEKGADPSARAKDKTTALCMAAAYGHEKVVKLLLDHNADPRVVDRNGWTPLYRAASKEHEAVVQLLIEKGASPSASDEERDSIFLVAAQVSNDDAQPPPGNRPDFSCLDLYERTPLYRAVSKGHESIVRMLLKLKVDLLGQAKDGRTILSVAAAEGHDTIVQLLLDEGLWPSALEMDAWAALSDKYGWTALHWAAVKGHENIFKSLLTKTKDFSGTAKDGRTLLSLAASEGHKSIVQMLLEKKVEVSTQDRYGRTPLYLAAAAGHEDVVKLLLENSANVSIPDGYGRQPLHCAAFGGHQAVVQLLFRRGAFISAQDKRGQTPLHQAVSAGKLEMTQLLLNSGASISVVEKDGKTILSLAASEGHEKITSLLLQNGANSSTQDSFGRTPLYQAATEGHYPVVQVLLEKGADTSIKDRYGRTPLYQAASEGHEAVVQLLLDNVANSSIKANNGKTALDRAVCQGHKEVITLLGTVPKTETENR